MKKKKKAKLIKPKLSLNDLADSGNSESKASAYDGYIISFCPKCKNYVKSCVEKIPLTATIDGKKYKYDALTIRCPSCKEELYDAALCERNYKAVMQKAKRNKGV